MGARCCALYYMGVDQSIGRYFTKYTIGQASKATVEFNRKLCVQFVILLFKVAPEAMNYLPHVCNNSCVNY